MELWFSGRHVQPDAQSKYDLFVPFDDAIVVASPKGLGRKWRLLLKKILKNKLKSLFFCSSAPAIDFSYDAPSYEKNFDQEMMCHDPDGASRSFSARFAVPSRIFSKGGIAPNYAVCT